MIFLFAQCYERLSFFSGFLLPGRIPLPFLLGCLALTASLPRHYRVLTEPFTFFALTPPPPVHLLTDDYFLISLKGTAICTLKPKLGHLLRLFLHFHCRLTWIPLRLPMQRRVPLAGRWVTWNTPSWKIEPKEMMKVSKIATSTRWRKGLSPWRGSPKQYVN